MLLRAPPRNFWGHFPTSTAISSRRRIISPSNRIQSPICSFRNYLTTTKFLRADFSKVQNDSLQILKANTSKIRTKGEKGDIKGMFDCLESMKAANVAPDLRTFNVLLQYCAKHGEESKIPIILSEMKQFGISPNIYTYNFIMDCFAHNGKVDQMMNLLTEMRNASVTPTIHTYTYMIHGYSTASKPEGFEQILEEMTNDDLEPDKYLYIFMIKACVRFGATDQMKRMFDKMRPIVKELDADSFRILLVCFKLVENEEVINALREMMKVAIIPTYIETEAMIFAFTKLRQWQNIVDIYEQSRDHIIHVVHYNRILVAYGMMGQVQSMVKTLQELKAKRIHPDAHTYDAVVSLACQGEGEAFEPLYNEMVRKGYCLLEPINVKMVVDFLVKKKRDPKMALKVYKEMQQLGSPIHETAYTTIIAGFAAEKDLSTMEYMLEELEKSVPQPSYSSFCALLHAFARLGTVHMDRILQWMTSCKYEYTEGIYNLMAMAHGNAHDVRSMEQVLAKARETGGVRTYSVGIAGYGKNNYIQQMIELFETAKKKQQDVSVLYGLVIYYLQKFQKLDLALHYFNEVERDGVVIPSHLLNPIVTLLVRTGELDQAYNTFQHMLLNGKTPFQSTYGYLIAAFAKSGNSPVVLELCSRLYEQHGKAIERIAYNCVLMNLGKIGELDTMMEWFESMKKVHPPDHRAYEIVVCYLGKHKSPMMAQAIHELKESGILPDARVWAIAAGGYTESGDVESLIEMLEQIKELQVLEHSENYVDMDSDTYSATSGTTDI